MTGSGCIAGVMKSFWFIIIAIKDLRPFEEYTSDATAVTSCPFHCEGDPTEGSLSGFILQRTVDT